jgi:hypothetical protein
MMTGPAGPASLVALCFQFTLPGAVYVLCMMSLIVGSSVTLNA